MTEISAEFVKLLRKVPRTARVLDIGAGGLGGENTTDTLLEYFGNTYMGICIRPEKVAEYKSKVPWANIVVGDFYKMAPFLAPVDVLVLDLNIDNNVNNDWTEEGLKRSWHLLKQGGILINYVLTADPNTVVSELIEKQRTTFWKSPTIIESSIRNRLKTLQEWKIVGVENERRRYEVIWVALKKK